MKRFLGIPRIDWIWILLFALWRFAIGVKHGLGVDEAHYVLYGLRPDWSYFDHPPLVGWIQAFFYFFLGQKEWVARIPANICGVLSTVLLYKWLKGDTRTDEEARLGALALNFSFLSCALWIMFLPDTLLLVLVLWLLTIVNHLLTRRKSSDWIWLGIALGLCGLTKYTAVFFIVSILGVVFSEKAWNLVKPFRLALVAVIGLALISPVLYWNFIHDWISFRYQRGHVMGGAHFDLSKLGTFIATQVLAYNPILIALSAWILFIKKSFTRRERISLWFALPTLTFFLYTSLKDEVLPHWTFIGWGLVIPLGLANASQHSRKAKWAVGVSAAITIFAMSELSFQFLKLPPYQSPYADLVGWHDLHRDIQDLAQKRGLNQFSVGVSNWTHGSRANYYLSDLGPVFVLDDRFDQFDFWENSQPHISPMFILAWRGFPLSDGAKKNCDKLEPVEKKTFLINSSPVNSVEIFMCHNYSFCGGGVECSSAR